MSRNEGVVVSEKGQVTIPKVIRDKLGLVTGSVLVFSVEAGRLVGQKDVGALPLGKWRGRGKLPRGLSVDAYLKLTRDGDSN